MHGHFVGFVMRWLKSVLTMLLKHPLSLCINDNQTGTSTLCILLNPAPIPHPCFFFSFFFDLGFMARQDYFTHFEPSQLLGGAKTGDPREKPPDHPQAELGLSHM